MKAWEVRDGELNLYDVDLPRPGTGERLVRVSHTGICGSDRPKLLHPDRFALPEPWRPGHEIVGTDPIGRTIAVDPLVPCNTCFRCEAGNIHLCPSLRRIGWDLPGGLATHLTIPVENARPVPAGVDPVHATLADPAAVAVHGVRCQPVGPPGRIAIIGAGTVGLLTALYALDQHWLVTVLHRDSHAPPETVTQAVPAAFRSPATLPHAASFDLVVDAASGTDPGPLSLALHLVRDGATIVVQNAYHPRVHLPVPLRDLFRRSIRLIGSFSYCRNRQDDFDLALDLLRRHGAEASHLARESGGLTDLIPALDPDEGRFARHVLTTCTDS